LIKTTDYNTFSGAFKAPTPVKKKSTSESQSVQKKKPTSSATMPSWMQSSLEQSSKKEQAAKKTVEQQRQGVYVSKEEAKGPEIKGTGGQYGFTVTPVSKEQKAINASVGSKVYSGFPGQEENKYRVKNNRWERLYGKNWVEVTNEGSVNALNNYFEKNLTTLKGEIKDDKQDLKRMRSVLRVEEEIAAGKKYNEKQFEERVQYYNTIETQKYLKSKGYDIDVNGIKNDPKTIKALTLSKTKKKTDQDSDFEIEDMRDAVDGIITNKFLMRTEEDAISVLRKQFGKYGFTFEESGVGTDYIKVTTPGQVEKEFGFDYSNPEIARAEAANMSNFIKKGYMTKKEKQEFEGDGTKMTREQRDEYFFNLVNLMGKNPYKYSTDLFSYQEMNNGISDIYSNLKSESKSLEYEYEDIQKRIEKFNEDPTDVKEKIAIDKDLYALKKKGFDIKEKYQKLNNTEKNLQKITGIEYAKKEKQGNFLGIITGQLAQGFTNVEKALLNLSADILPYAIGEDVVDPQTRLRLKEEGYTDSQILDYASKQLKRTVVKDITEGITRASTLGTTTKEYINSSDRNDLEKTVSFLSESIGTAFSAGGNPVLQKVAFFTQSYNAMEEQMSSPEFDGLTEWEKKLISVPYGFVIGSLERYGFAALGAGKNPIVNRFATRVVGLTMKSLPKDASISTIKREINKNVSRMLGEGALRVVGGAFVEGATEGTQQLAEIAEKNIVNDITDKDYFKDVPDLSTAEGIGEALKIAKTDAYYGFLGGLLYSTVSNSVDVRREHKFNKKTDEEFKLFYDAMTDNKIIQSNKLQVKIDLKDGKITKNEAKERINSINETSSTLKSINSNLSLRDKKDAYNLILEREKLTTEKAPLDEALQAPYNDRIKEINDELKVISENAIKESEQQKQEVTAEGGGIQREGVVEGQPEVGQGEGTVGQATTNEADLGDRPVEGRSKEEIDARISELDTMLADNIATIEETGTGKLSEAEVEAARSEIEALKAEVPVEVTAEMPAAKAAPKITETTDTKSYSEALSSAKAELKEEGNGLDLQVSDVSQEEADQIVAEGGKIFMTEDGLAGAYVKKDGYMGGLFKSPRATYKKVAKLLQQARIKEGGRFMDAYATELEKIYIENGFRPVARLKFNEEYAPEGWNAPGSALASKPDVVFFAYDPDGKYKIGDGEYMTDYDAAYEMAKNFDSKVSNEADKLAELMKGSTVVEGTNEQVDALIKEISDSEIVVAERTILEQVANAKKALKSILPNVKFVLHSTNESYKKAVGDSSRGAYDPKNKVIHINLTKANNRTVMHEVFHAIIISKVSSDAKLQSLTKNMVKSVMKSLKQSGANQNVITYLEEFSAGYEVEEQNEEKLSELFALLGETYKMLDYPTQNIIQRFLERVAKMFGLKEMTDREVVDFMNSLSGQVEAGKEITTKEFKASKVTIKDAVKRFQANFKDEVSGLEFVYDENGEKFAELEKNGFITKNKSIVDFNDKYVFFHQPDAAFSGIIAKRNKKTGEVELLIEGKGGMYYPIKFHKNGYFWASTSSVAKTMAKDLNESMKKNNGKLLMALTTAPNDKLLSSTTAANSVMELISSKAFDKNFDINTSQLKNILINAAAATKETKELIKDSDGNNLLDKNGQKQYKIKISGLGIKIKKGDSLEDVKSKIKELLNPDKSSFADRKTFVEAMIKESVSIINSNPKAISQFGEFFSSGIQNKYFKGIKKKGYSISAANMKQALSEMLTEPMLKEGVDRDKGGQIYAVIELDGGPESVDSDLVEAVDSDLHESYPKAIKSINPDNKVILHILTDRVKWNEVAEDFETNDIVASEKRQSKIYPTSGVSVRALKINTKNVVKEEENTSKAQIEEEVNVLDSDIDTNKPNFRKQKASKQAAVIVKKGKEANLSDAGIREYMKRNGYTDRQATDAIQSYNDKKEGIFIDPEWSKLRRAAVVFKRKFLSARGLMPNSVFALNENRQADIAKSLNMAEKTIVDFNRAMKKVPKANRDKVRKDFDDYIRGYTEVDLPVDLKKVADTMRAHIDSMSESLMNSGLVDEHTAEKIKDNLGEYLTRSYRVYDRANWKNEVEEEVKQRAINFLKTQYMPMAQEIADKEGMDVDDVLDTIVTNKFNEILTKDGAENFITGGKIGSKDTSILKERQDIPLEIRMLMGEYTDPAQNYAKTILKMSALAANHQFLTEVKNNGTGVFLFKKDDPRRPKGFDYMIAAEGSDTMNPLNGMYTTKEIKEEFEKQPAQLGAIMETYMRALSLVKWGKTIGSLMTHMKNVFGNLGFVLLNGHWRVNEMGRAYKTVKNDLFSKDKAGLRDYMNKLIELGIVKQSAGIGELRAMFKDADWDTAMIERINKNTGSKWDWIKSKFSKGAKFMEDLYQSEDDFFKIVAYENELSRYSKAMFGKSKNELTQEERAEVDKVVAEIVKNTYPTYSRIPELVNMIRRFPFVGNFISFQAESYRTAFNTAILAKDEIKSDNPGVRQIGAQRLVGSITYMSAKTAILSYFSYAAGMGAVGILGYFTDDDEEKQKEDDVRKFIAPWSKNSDLIVLKASNGKVQYIDFSSSDPHGGINKAINSAFIGKTTVDGFINALGSAIEPFIGEEMTTAAILAVKNNIDAYGKPIYNPEDTFYEKAKDISAYMLNVVQPGTVSTARKMYESDSKLNEAVGAATGMRIYDVDVAKSFGYSMITYRDRMEDAKRIYNSEVYNKDATEKSIADAKKRAERAITKINEEIYDRYYAAVRLGANEDILFENLKTFGRMSLIDMKFMFGQVPYLLREKAAPEEE
jgi:hypothetical protein